MSCGGDALTKLTMLTNTKKEKMPKKGIEPPRP